MPLLGTAALLLSFDITPEAVAEHDDWHTHEHLPERLAIPGFLRGSRWTATGSGPGYFVMYEVKTVAVLTSPAYLARLDRPSAWTARMMPHYRGMARGLCEVVASLGRGIGHHALLLRVTPAGAAGRMLVEHLRQALLPSLPAQRGLCSAHLFRSAAAAPMTAEQSIRGTDAGVGAAVLVTGYDRAALDRLAKHGLDPARLDPQGEHALTVATYAAACSFTAGDVAASPARP